jgi:hypothetical protein
MKSKLMGCLLAAVVAAGLAGCVTSESMPVGEQTYPARPVGHAVDVYLEDDAPVFLHRALADYKETKAIPANAVEIGRVDANGAPSASWQSVVDSAKVKARALGGDGLVLKDWNKHLKGISKGGTAYEDKEVMFTVVRYVPADAQTK